MNLSEALEVKNIGYSSTRDDYTVNDPNPSILVIDKDYNVDGNGRSVLAFNLNYLNKISNKDRRNLITRVNKIDNKILDIGAIKAWLRSVFNTGDYNLSKNQKLERYNKIVKEIPELKKIIRRYKYPGIEGKIK